MEKYELGKQYKMKVIEIRQDSAGHNYIALYDENDPSKEHRVYNILKCQNEELPDYIWVTVKSIDAFGKIRFKQDEEHYIREHYAEGKPYPFEIVEVREDYNSKKPYYVIEDDKMAHHYYFLGEQKYQVGDSCILEVEGFTEKGFLKLKEFQHVNEVQETETAVSSQDYSEPRINESWSGLPVLEGLEESETLELKTSIAFPPDGNGVADIDKQLHTILKELTAFMNTKGGELYIGVHDKTKKVIGIADDFGHLNDGEDEYAGAYKQDIDGYELKIRNTIDRSCQGLANSLITFEFPKLEGKTYCKITVRPARRPIFLYGTKLYVRQGNRLKLLQGDEITFFVTDRMTISIREIVDSEGLSNTSIDGDSIKHAIREILNERYIGQNSVPLPKVRDLGEIDYWIVWYEDSSWKRIRTKSEESNVYMQIPVYKQMGDSVLAFCYASGKVNTIKLTDFRKGANLNAFQKNGWSRTGEKPQSIFLMLMTDFLVGYSVDCNGIEYVKLHAILDFRNTTSAQNEGAPFIPLGHKMEQYVTIGAEHISKLKHLIVPKEKRSQNAGTPMNTVNQELSSEIEYLQSIFK